MFEDRKAILLQPKFIKQKEYWVNKMSSAIPGTEILPHRKKEQKTQKSPAKIEMVITNPLYDQLQKLSKNSSISLYMVLLAVLKILIFKYTGREDITVISPLYRADISSGSIVSGIPGETQNRLLFIRDYICNDMSFLQLLLKIRQSVLEAYENQDYPSENLVQYLFDMDTIDGRHDSFISDIVCLLSDIHDTGIFEKVSGGNTIVFSFAIEENQVNGHILFDPDCYETVYIRQASNHFLKILVQSLEDINLRISSISFLAEVEAWQLLVTFNTSRYQYPLCKTIHGLFASQVEQTPDRIAVKSNEYCAITYRELNKRANQLARWLGKKGIRIGDIVCILNEPSLEMVIGILGILKVGGGYLPVDPQQPEKRVKYMLEDSRAQLLLAQPHLIDSLEPGCDTLDINDKIIYQYKNENAGPNREETVTSRDMVYIIYTSGTTGRPKGVLIIHDNLINYLTWFWERVEVTTGEDKALLTASIAFDLGYTSLYSSLLKGCELHIAAREVYLSADKLVNYLGQHEVTYLKMTPSHFTIIASHPALSAHICPKLRLVVLGGEAIKLEDVERFHSLCKHIEIMNHYGPTEATIGCIARMIDFNKFDQYKALPTIGKPINNSVIYIVNRNMNLVPVGIPGELCISGRVLARGYLNRPELTAEKFYRSYGSYKSYIPKKIYKTADLARWLPDGNIEFLGRLDEQVKLRGYRIELKEIESQLLKTGHIKEVVTVVTGAGEERAGDEENDKYLCAYIVSDRKLVVSELREKLSENLPEYMIPTYLVMLDKIPLTPNGKIDRRALPAPGTGDLPETEIAPRNEIEKKLVGIWSEILGLEQEIIGINSNFFQLGGHSLKATGMIANIHKEMRVKVPLDVVFKIPTIKELAKYIKGVSTYEYAPVELVEKKEFYVLSSAQKRLFTFQQLWPENTSYNLSRVVTLMEDPGKEKPEEIFRKLLSRHESLHTSFEIIDEEPIQRVLDSGDVEFEIEYYGVDTVQEIIRRFVRPFDLSHAPLLRVGVVNAEPAQKLLLYDLHHITADGASRGILEREFTALWNGEQLPTLKIQYKDYSEWMNREQQRDLLKQQETYWMNILAGELPTLNLPTDYERPNIQSFEGDYLHFTIDKKETREIKKAAKKEDVTLYIYLFAVFNILLSKLSEQEDIIVGIPIEARRHTDIGHTIGMFVNTLIMRNYPTGEKSFREFLMEVKKCLLDAYENQEYQFLDLLEKVTVIRDTGRNPIFDVVFNLVVVDQSQEINHTPVPEANGETTFERIASNSKVDLSLAVIDNWEEINFNCEYSKKLFKEQTIKEFIDYFREILSGLKENSSIQLKDIRFTQDLLESESYTPQMDFEF